MTFEEFYFRFLSWLWMESGMSVPDGWPVTTQSDMDERRNDVYAEARYVQRKIRELVEYGIDTDEDAIDQLLYCEADKGVMLWEDASETAMLATIFKYENLEEWQKQMTALGLKEKVYGPPSPKAQAIMDKVVEKYRRDHNDYEA